MERATPSDAGAPRLRQSELADLCRTLRGTGGSVRYARLARVYRRMAWLRSVDEFTGSLNNIEGFTQGTGEMSPLTALQWGGGGSCSMKSEKRSDLH